MFGINIKRDGVIDDPELEEARKSMRGRIDGDDTVVLPKEEPKDPVTPPEPTPVVEKKVEEPEKPEEEPKEKVTEPDPKDPNNHDKNPINREEAYIPVPKYLEEKKQWKQDKAEKERLAARVAELEGIGKDTTVVTKPEDIEAFATKHNVEPEMVKDLLAITQSNLLPAEKQAQIDKALSIVDEKNRQEAITKANEQFVSEFNDEGVPAIKKLYPNATDTQLAEARKLLDKAAHTEEYKTTKLRHIVVDLESELSSIFTTSPNEPEQKPPVTKKSMEHGRTGATIGTLTAKDFKGKTDFTDLLAMDPIAQESIRKEMDTDTYKNYSKFMISKEKENGVEVMRNGRKISLK